MTINYYSYEELKAAVIANASEERKTLEVEIEKRLTCQGSGASSFMLL